ncbi:archaeosine biosynthesis radical SAM protein RaSEA [Archaeoglobus sp.]
MSSITNPVAVWIEKERLYGEVVDCLTVILRTRGCSWNRCLMCGYKKDTDPRVTNRSLKKQLEKALKKGKAKILKIFTSGSFFELDKEFRDFVYYKVSRMGFEKLIVESRPEFVYRVEEDLEKIEFELEVGIGLETSNDFVREHCINKGFTFEDFKEASKFLKSKGFRVKVYLLLRPPFLSEREAIEDAIKSIEDVKDLADVVSLNPTNVQSGTYLEGLWRWGIYRPPWLWSVVEVLKNSNLEIVSDPVGAGSLRGPHNCGKCDKAVARAIREFSLYQDLSVFENLSCRCLKLWKKVLELENYSRVPLTM